MTEGYRWPRDLRDLVRVAVHETTARRAPVRPWWRLLRDRLTTSNYVGSVPGPSNKGEA